MANSSASDLEPAPLVSARHAGLVAAVCVALGLGIGYLSRGLEHAASPSVSAAAAVPPAHPRMPTLEDMKRMADKQAAPLLEKLKSSPRDSALLMKVGAIYHGSHQFKEAAGYYAQAVKADPKNLPLRNRLASSLYRSGDVDGAIEQLKEALSYDSKDANSLFNLGMIQLQGKGNGKGALAAWQHLLKSNPQLSADRRAEVQKLMADVLTNVSQMQPAEGARGK